MSPLRISATRWDSKSQAVANFVVWSLVAALLVTLGVTPIAIGALSAGQRSLDAVNALPTYLKIQPLSQTTTIYGTKGGQPVALATFYAQNRVDVNLDQVADTMKNAAIDTEDPRFYSEGGVDVRGTIRGLLSTATGHGVQGGSSITQQYVKNVLVQRCETDYPVDGSATAAKQAKQQAALDACYNDAAGVSVGRKLQEIRYAVSVAKSYSKDQILQGYLNIVGFGGQVYGVQAAAKYYFGTTAAQLTIGQAATLTAILNNPANLRIDQDAADNPDNNASNGFALTKERRDYVLQRMYDAGDITAAQLAYVTAAPIQPHITPTDSGCMAAQKYNAGFFCSYVVDVMLSDPKFGATADDRFKRFLLGGMKVYTTLNLDLNTVAQNSVSAYIPSHKAGIDLGAANVSVEVGTGRIVTMVTNRKYNDTAQAPPGSTSINYATPADMGGSTGFQTGSSFKAFDLAAWLEAGHHVYDTVNGSSSYFDYDQFKASCTQLQSGTFQVANDESDEGGYMSVLTATANSVNTAFMAMAEQLDLCDIANVAHKFGVTSSDPDFQPWTVTPSMVIGTNIVSPLQMAAAYAGIANNGVYCTPIAIDHIVSRTDGSALPVPTSTCTRAVPADVAHAMAYTLQAVLQWGTAETANPWDGTQILGKTGTTDYALQNWLITSTTRIAQATWVGNVSGKQDMAYQYFGPYGNINGRNVKFSIVKPIQTALDKAYPSPPFPTAPSKLLYGYDYSYTPPTTPPGSTSTATPGADAGTAGADAPSAPPSGTASGLAPGDTTNGAFGAGADQGGATGAGDNGTAGTASTSGAAGSTGSAGTAGTSPVSPSP